MRPRDKQYSEADGGGLVLQVHTNGSKLWRFRYRFEGKANMLSIGIYPYISLAQARERRDEAKKLLAIGINPSEKRRDDKAHKEVVKTSTFEMRASKWLNHWRHSVSPRHADYTERRLLVDINPLIGHLAV